MLGTRDLLLFIRVVYEILEALHNLVKDFSKNIYFKNNLRIYVYIY